METTSRSLTARGLLVRLLLLLPVLGILLAAEWKIRQVPNLYERKHAYFLQAAPQLHTLLLGASHTLFGVNPQGLGPGVYNLGLPSQSLRYDLALLQQNLPHLPKLRRVIFTISYPSLEADLTPAIPESWREYQYRRYWHLRNPDYSSVNLRNYSLLFTLTPLRSLQMIRQWTGSDSLAGLSHAGWMASSLHASPVSLDERHAASLLAIHHLVMQPSLRPALEAELRQAIAKLQQRGIEVVIITPPVHAAYIRAARGSSLRLNKVFQQGLQQVYGVRWLNYQESTLFEAADFQDLHHLNAQGATKFTALLAADLAALK